ncbi:microfibrillar-associated protein 1-like [Littorina saxatilis]|uniref:Micro-fibrillar-associated protein 1 C-terminal domain-containing protein n=1 Tax=Littorina saxatilis TaxID=31220 RepID=A0AAN9B6A8_9CAEN
MTSKSAKVPILSTAGAVPMKNDKGEVTMEKVKVTRYVTGKRPDYAPDSSSDEDEEFGFQATKGAQPRPEEEEEGKEDEPEDEEAIQDRRLRRLQQRERIADDSDDEEDRVTRHRRQVIEPEILAEESDEEAKVAREDKGSEEEEEEEEELDEEEIERRRAFRRQRALQRRDEEEVMDVEEEKSEGETEEESSEYEEYTDSEEETGPRLKPVFVRKKERVTIQEREREEQKQKELDVEAKKLAEDRRRQTLKMAETELRREMEEEKQVEDMLGEINTDDDNDEEEYESWKVRELKRIKRNRDEREAIEREKMELDRVRNMTEEERRQEFRVNPKQVTNKAPKGKYKFLQKYYHRGAFYVSKEEDQTYKQDFSQPTLDDHFDKTILPKVMQVKNFGRSGRTKYTHLLDQDTTQFDSPWIADSMQNLKFHTSKSGGTKQVFARPSSRTAQK